MRVLVTLQLIIKKVQLTNKHKIANDKLYYLLK